MHKEQIAGILSARLSDSVAQDIVEHYAELRTAVVRGDSEKALLRAGKLVECITKGLIYVVDGVIPENVKVHDDLLRVSKSSKLEPAIRFTLVKQMLALYELRSNRGGAHASFDPLHFDSRAGSSIATWIITELLRTWGNGQATTAEQLAIAINTNAFTLVEDFEDDLIVLKPGLGARIEIVLILYHKLPARVTTTRLKSWLLHYSGANVSVSVANLIKSRHIHRNANGLLLTALGRQLAEDTIRSHDVMQR